MRRLCAPLSENLKADFPDLQQAGFVDLSASYLYATPHCAAVATNVLAPNGVLATGIWLTLQADLRSAVPI